MATKTPDANDLLFGSASPAMTFEDPGATIRFRVISQGSQHRREVKFDTTTNRHVQGEHLYWNNGKVTTEESAQPALDPVITVQSTFTAWEGVSNRERAFGKDDGMRRIFVRGRKAEGSLMDAIKEACRNAGVRKIEAGQFGEVTFESEGKRAAKSMNPPKIYTAKWYDASNPPAWVSELPALDGDDSETDEDNPFGN